MLDIKQKSHPPTVEGKQLKNNPLVFWLIQTHKRSVHRVLTLVDMVDQQLERATVEETELPAKQIVRFIRIGVGTQPLRS